MKHKNPLTILIRRIGADYPGTQSSTAAQLPKEMLPGVKAPTM